MDFNSSLFSWFVVIVLVISPLFVVTAIPYCLGCLSEVITDSEHFLHDDARKSGGENAGRTRFLRDFDGPLTFSVILCVALTSVLSVLIGAGVGWFIGAISFVGAFGDSLEFALVLGKYWAATFYLLGHKFPVLFDVKEGKSILFGGIVALMLDWRLALLVWGGFLILTALTRYVSLGSTFAAVAFPVGTWLFVSHSLVIMCLAVFLGGLILWKHRGNIQRLLKGEESKLSFHKKETK